jgi:hypothetical protein
MVVEHFESSLPRGEHDPYFSTRSDVLPWADPYIVRLLSSQAPSLEQARGPRLPLDARRPDEPPPGSHARLADRDARERPSWDCRSSPV